MYSRKFPELRKFVMLLGDIAIIMLAYMLVMGIADIPVEADISNLSQIGFVSLAIALSIVMLNINGLYSIEHKVYADILLRIVVSDFCVFIILLAVSVGASYTRENVLMLLAANIVQSAGLAIWRYLGLQLERFLHDQRRLMLIGSAEEIEHVYHRLSLQPQLNMKLKFVCTDMENSDWQKAVDEVDVVMICPELRHWRKVAIMNYSTEHGKQVRLIPNTFELFCSGATLDRIDDIPVLRPQSLMPSLETCLLKRIMDIVIGALGFICATPLMLAAAIAIKIGDPGPLLYSQTRVGRGGKEFKVYKFRTMRVDAEKYSGPMLAQENDPRITRVGRIIRTIRLDELPQIWNVIKGDMSIVGPRPERPFFVKQFIAEMPEYAYRHNVKPGITGLAQICGKYNTTPFDKLVYDLDYIQHCSFLGDLVIILQTVRVLFTKSATEGTGKDMKELDIEKYDIAEREIYGDF